MSSLAQGLLSAGFKKGQDRLDALVAALRSADFFNLEDMRCADRYPSALFVSSCYLLFYVILRLLTSDVFPQIPHEDLAFVEQVAKLRTNCLVSKLTPPSL